MEYFGVKNIILKYMLKKQNESLWISSS